MDQPCTAALVEPDLHEVDAARRGSPEQPRDAPEPLERLRADAHARHVARTRASGLDLDDDELTDLEEEEVRLAGAGLEPPREEAPAARAERTLDQPLAG